MFRFREIANAIAEEEVGLLQARSASAARSLHNARVLTIAALITQRVLLGGMIFLSERQAARRERAENDSRAATLRSQHIVQTIREPIVVLDHQLRLLMHNTAFSEFYGTVGDQQAGLHLGESRRRHKHHRQFHRTAAVSPEPLPARAAGDAARRMSASSRR